MILEMSEQMTMRGAGIWAVLGVVTMLNASSATGQTREETLAIVGVNVVPMDTEVVLSDQTVIIRGDRIISVSARGRTEVPADARVIDGRGRFLMPGLQDMHVHVGPYQGPEQGRTPDYLRLLVAKGVTTARSMVGHDTHVALRDAVSRGEVIGPRLFVAAPQITGPNASPAFLPMAVHTVAEARARVQAARAAGFDLVKITFGLTPELFEAIAETTREEGIPLSGHVTGAIGLERAMRARQQIEHLDPYLDASARADAPVRAMVSQGAPGAVVLHTDTTIMRSLARRSAAEGIVNTPTLNLFQVAFIGTTPPDSLRQLPDAQYWPEASIDAMTQGRTNFLSNIQIPDAERRAYADFRNLTTRMLVEEGAMVMMGSDSPQQFMMLGFAAHREIRALEAAGLSRYQALRASTVVPAQYLGIADDVGTVRTGMIADLVLLGANPLADLDAFDRIEGVVLRGEFLDETALAELLEVAKP